jgi:hypothetical protein
MNEHIHTMRKPSAAITRARCKISEEGTFIAKYGHLPLLEINIESVLTWFLHPRRQS